LSSSFPSNASFIEGELMLLRLRRVIFLTSTSLAGAAGFTGDCKTWRTGASLFSSGTGWFENMGSRKSSGCDGSAIFFLM
jgi:hypothetical protein